MQHSCNNWRVNEQNHQERTGKDGEVDRVVVLRCSCSEAIEHAPRFRVEFSWCLPGGSGYAGRGRASNAARVDGTRGRRRALRLVPGGGRGSRIRLRGAAGRGGVQGRSRRPQPGALAPRAALPGELGADRARRPARASPSGPVHLALVGGRQPARPAPGAPARRGVTAAPLGPAPTARTPERRVSAPHGVPRPARPSARARPPTKPVGLRTARACGALGGTLSPARASSAPRARAGAPPSWLPLNKPGQGRGKLGEGRDKPGQGWTNVGRT